MNFKQQKYPNWIASKTMVGRTDFTGDQKWIFTVLIAALVAINKRRTMAVNPTLSGVAKAIGRTVEDLKGDFEDLKDHGYISYNKKGEILCLYVDRLEEDGIIDPGSIPNV